MQKCQAEGIDVCRYGADLTGMVEIELQTNVWAVRFLYSHILNRGLCLRPSWGMVGHIGPDADATYVDAESWARIRRSSLLRRFQPRGPSTQNIRRGTVCGRRPVARVQRIPGVLVASPSAWPQESYARFP